MASRAFEKEQMLMPLILASADRFWSKVDVGTSDQCWKWMASTIAATPGKTKSPKGKFTVKTKGRAYFFISSRFAWLLEKGPIPEGKLVCHRCDNPMCCNPGHLFLGTSIENAKDMVSKGRVAGAAGCGENNIGAKLTERDAQEVKYLAQVQPSISFDEIGKMYGIAHSTVSRIASGALWPGVASL